MSANSTLVVADFSSLQAGAIEPRSFRAFGMFFSGLSGLERLCMTKNSLIFKLYLEG